MNLGDQRVEQKILVRGWRGCVRSLRGLGGPQDPSHRCGLAGRINEAKCIHAVERAVVEPGRGRLTPDDLQRLHRFRMVGGKRLHFGGVGLAAVGVRLGGEELLVEGFGGAEREHWQMDHRGPPQFVVGQGELEPQAPHGVHGVGRVGLAAAQRETTEHRHAAWLEDRCFREPDAVPVALEETRNTDALGVVAAETGVNAADLLERIGEPRGRQRIRSEPTAEVGEAAGDRRQDGADQSQSCPCAGGAEAQPGVGRCLLVDRHVLLLLNHSAD